MLETNEKRSVSRRSMLGATAAALSACGIAWRAMAQTRQETAKGEQDHSASNPGPVNKALWDENLSSEIPPTTDRGVIEPIWYSFDLTHRRVQEGGWTRQVTQRELPSSTDLAGVTMRLTAGSYRELHWHTANEWAYMLYGNARVSVFNPNDSTIFIGDVGEGDLWFFPSGFPHSIQGLGPDGCEFLLVFDEGMFSEYTTSLITDFVAHTPRKVVSQNFNIPEGQLSNLPEQELYIFPGTLPGSLEDDRRAVGGSAVASKIDYTFRMKAMKPNADRPGGTVRIVDSSNFPAAKTIAAALFTLKPGALREMHWHPNASEWQYYIQGSAQMTVLSTGGNARTMNYNPNDVGFAPMTAGHSILSTGNEDLIFLALFKSSYFSEVSFDQWLRRLPVQMVQQHLGLSANAISRIPDTNNNIFAPL